MLFCHGSWEGSLAAELESQASGFDPIRSAAQCGATAFGRRWRYCASLPGTTVVTDIEHRYFADLTLRQNDLDQCGRLNVD